MKIYVHYEDNDTKPVTLKISLPKKWESQPLLQVLELFIESHNKKTQEKLDATKVHFEKSSGEVLYSSEIVQDAVSDGADLYVRHGALGERGCQRKEADQSEIDAPNVLLCKNYGCNKTFSEDTNTDTSCKFHTAPPVFHDTKKGWACCPKRVYDWDEFQMVRSMNIGNFFRRGSCNFFMKSPRRDNSPHQIKSNEMKRMGRQIEGCSTGRHSTVDPKTKFAPSPTVSAAVQAEANAGNVLRSIEDYNRKNPEAATAHKSAMSALQKPPACTIKEDGTATCLNKGCQMVFRVQDNHPHACRHHRLGPVFHDAGKFWQCCPDTVRYDFDTFLKIPGCLVGYHHDGSGESVKRQELSTPINTTS